MRSLSHSIQSPFRSLPGRIGRLPGADAGLCKPLLLGAVSLTLVLMQVFCVASSTGA
ncbi:hypothetical protein [Roseibium suaedae]|uniref:hypothetical protein n=1 Tax=Roseibium suaedae TaxID=735517 RepID=UPI001587FBC7|nr:hypothetical protein [Roseibium suaedae]